MKIVRWGLAAVAFAATVTLAVHTAALGSGNTTLRAHMQRLDEQCLSFELRLERLRAEWRERTAGERLSELFRDLVIEGDRSGGVVD